MISKLLSFVMFVKLSSISCLVVQLRSCFGGGVCMFQGVPKIYRIVKFVVSSFGLDSIPLTQVSVLGPCYESSGITIVVIMGDPKY